MMDALPDTPDEGPSSTSEDHSIQIQPKTFRILIMGRANSGKTTILHNICQSDKPVVRRIMRGTHHAYLHNGGISVRQYWGVLPNDSDDVVAPSRERGIHDIHNEIIFPSSPGFIFHDSYGIESGVRDELEVVQQFIKTRASSRSLEERLHAIWFCLPADTDRPLLDAELRFFAQDPLGVPVIAIFTKFDAQHIKAYEQMRSEGMSPKQAKLQAPDKALRFLQEYLRPRIMSTPYPPAGCMSLRDMHKADASCTNLIRQTANALTNDKLQQIFISTQKNNIKLCVEFAIHKNFHETLQRGRTVSQNLLILAAWFPLTTNKELFRKQEIKTADFTDLVTFVSNPFDNIRMSKRASYMMAAKALIILENCSYRSGTLKENIAGAIADFKKTEVLESLRKRIKKEADVVRTDEELQRWLYEVICDHLMDHSVHLRQTIPANRALMDSPNISSLALNLC